MASADDKVRARLMGFQEVPVVSTEASGTFDAMIRPRGDAIDYELTYTGMQGIVTQWHMHVGQRSVNGGIVLWIGGNARNHFDAERPRAALPAFDRLDPVLGQGPRGDGAIDLRQPRLVGPEQRHALRQIRIGGDGSFRACALGRRELIVNQRLQGFVGDVAVLAHCLAFRRASSEATFAVSRSVPCSSALRSRSRARASRDITVPIGMANSFAISR